MSRIRAAVVCGGPSAEAEVSRSSGAEVAAALEGRVEHVAIAEHGPGLCDQLRSEAINVVFPVMHGPPGEDGTLQGFLETIGMPYVGSGVLSSAAAMNKPVAKLIYRTHGLPVAAERLTSPTLPTVSATDLAAELGLPVVCKPIDQGSAVGVRFCQDEDHLATELATGEALLFEQFISGREITVGVLESEAGVKALPVLEVRTPDGGWYDYEHRYTPGLSEHLVPAPLDSEVASHLQQLAVAAHQALGCRDLSRSDFVLADTDAPVLLETNTMPGMTATSLYPDQARAAGIEFDDLVTGLVERAHARART